LTAAISEESVASVFQTRTYCAAALRERSHRSLALPRACARNESRAEAKRALEISQENKRYCEKWGMPAGTHEHIICTMDLDAIRAEVEWRIAEEYKF
jgi:hypothetical protein